MTFETELHLRITAYLDGAMSEDERAEFEREMERNPELVEEVARLDANDDLLREAMSIDQFSEVDEALLAKMGLAESAVIVGQGEEGPTAPTPANDNPPLWKRLDFRAGAAIAASLALVLTFTIPGDAAPGLGDALDQTPSGQMAVLESGATVTPILTFEAGDGRFCREFAVETAGSSSSAIACRGSQGWSVEAWGNGAVDIPNDDEIVLASGSEPEALDDAYARLDASDPFSNERERRIIENKWDAE